MFKIFVGNLNFSATEEGLRALFGQFGTIQSVNIMTDRYTGQSRGFGFVEMGSEAEGRKAIAGLNRMDFEGRTLNVNEARPREDRGFGGRDRESGGGQRRYNRY